MANQLSPLFALSSRQSDLPISAQDDHYRRLIQKLPRRTQQIFLLSRLDQLAYGDITQLLELDVGAVERSMFRVLQQCADDHADAPVPDDIRQHAQRWYVHLQSPQATASQRIEFRHWLDADPLHLQAFEATERLWRRLQTPAAILGASGWHRRKRRGYLGWLLLTAFLCSLLVTAEAFY
ncbi:DUF4880 domain-containing protein [Pseudomonas sp. NPDC090202]|uniref:DUF4880 domain-containing protein n=1 Tax=unclassified Pseudomonas TaxID=196821 RepID=UPI003818792E